MVLKRRIILLGKRIINGVRNFIKKRSGKKKSAKQPKPVVRTTLPKVTSLNITTMNLKNSKEAKITWEMYSYDLGCDRALKGECIFVKNEFGAVEELDFEALPSRAVINLVFVEIKTFENVSPKFWSSHGKNIDSVTFIRCNITRNVLLQVQKNCLNLFDICCVSCEFVDRSMWVPTTLMDTEEYKDYRQIVSKLDSSWIQNEVMRLSCSARLKPFLNRLWVSSPVHIYANNGQIKNFVIEFKTGIKHLALRTWTTDEVIISLCSDRLMKIHKYENWSGWHSFKKPRQHPNVEHIGSMWMTRPLRSQNKRETIMTSNKISCYYLIDL